LVRIQDEHSFLHPTNEMILGFFSIRAGGRTGGRGRSAIIRYFALKSLFFL
jgi:hypothetical protein